MAVEEARTICTGVHTSPSLPLEVPGRTQLLALNHGVVIVIIVMLFRCSAELVLAVTLQSAC